MRQISFSKALNEAHHQAMELDPSVVVLGQLVDYPAGIFGTTAGLVERFGSQRVQDFPVAEALMTSAAIGASVAGMRPVVVHQRLDFMLYSLDAIVNWMALWRFKSNGKSNVPMVIRAIVGKGWGQGPQHSKSLHAWFAHLPGIRVAVPATAYDAKGLFLEAIFGEVPTLIIEGRSLFSMTDQVPEHPYRIPFGQAAIRRPGSDLTIVALGMMVPLALRCADLAAKEGIEVEVIDLRTVAPLDLGTIMTSVRKTRRLIAADPAWRSVGIAAEVIASVSEVMGDRLLSKPMRLCLPDSHTPMSSALEEQYYPDEKAMLAQIRQSLGKPAPVDA